jgi:hypothetical protein
MSLPACVLQWPRAVSRQVMCALFMPAQDMHPEHARVQVPRTLWALPAAPLSRGLETPPTDWPAELDGSRIDHRLSLLPRSVLEQVAWNLGLVIHGPNLRKLVLREQVQTLNEQGLQDHDWQLALSSSIATSAPTAPEPLPALNLTEWPQRLKQSGFMALQALAVHMGPVLGQRLSWKLPPDFTADVATTRPSNAQLQLAYTPAVSHWSAQWDSCLSQLKPQAR